ncbi:MAG: hypothetical protein MSG64_07485 [Pyrinomonadaceae bacterium MAG19_C2-C3]|nr:hypothetical protein [Pyrinomonadaceae bacterium MAG19_C2-C3]
MPELLTIIEERTYLEINDASESVLLEIVTDADVEILEIAEQGPPGPPGTGTSGIEFEYLAGKPLGGQRAVILDTDGRLVYADHRTLTHRFRVLGITLHAALTDEPVLVRAAGVISEPSWTWTADLPIFVATDGQLTQVPPLFGFHRSVGVALTEAEILVRIELPILLAA